MADTTLVAVRRPEQGSRPAGRLRREGQLPGIVYGLGADNVSVTVSRTSSAHPLEDGRQHAHHAAARRQERARARPPAPAPPGEGQRHPRRLRARARRPDDPGRDPRAPRSATPRVCRRAASSSSSCTRSRSRAKPGDFPPSIEHDVSARSRSATRSTSATSPCRRVSPCSRRRRRPRRQISAPRGLAEGEAEGPPRGEEAPRVRPRAAKVPARDRGLRLPRHRGARSVLRRGSRSAERTGTPPTSWWSGSAIPATSTRARGTTSVPRSSSCSRAGTAASCTKTQGARARSDEVRVGDKRRRARDPAHVHERLGRGGRAARAPARRGARADRDRARRARPPARGAAREGRRRARRPQRAALDQAAPAHRRVPARAHRRRQADLEGAGADHVLSRSASATARRWTSRSKRRPTRSR